MPTFFKRKLIILCQIGHKFFSTLGSVVLE